MILWNCNFQFLPLVPLTPKLCGNSFCVLLLPQVHSKSLQEKLLGIIKKEKPTFCLLLVIWGGGCLCFKHIQDLQMYVIS